MLSSTMRTMLDACGRLMADDDEDGDLDFFPLRDELRKSRAECINHLATRVERLTSGRRTVREIPHNVIVAPMGHNLFVTVCDGSTPAGKVTDLTDEMTPYIISPGQGLGCAKAQRK